MFVEVPGYKAEADPAKCAFAVKSGILLGHIVSQEGLSKDLGKEKAIQCMEPLSNTKELERFIRYLAHVACTLYQLTKKDAWFTWITECQHAFELLKKMLTQAPIMVSPEWSKIFHLYTDASDRALGGALIRKNSWAISNQYTMQARH